MNPSFADHSDVVSDRHRFGPTVYRGTPWDLSHLDAFALQVDIGGGLVVDLVVLFSCHCFSSSLENDPRGPSGIPQDEIFTGTHERRVLNEERYLLSQLHLRGLINTLHKRAIRLAVDNYFTYDTVDHLGRAIEYAVFFTVEKDAKRAKRLLLRVQSAYPLEAVSRRLANGQKISFINLMKRTYEGRPLRR